ncbi:YbjN domain-containing protein [Jongsikchunia kroppenstedtii]|uniref:YbjN domain-containing protein n=1 Tax=Jongsikchunia kroppenstedtii TaxID=1121721 RepID=UPI00037AC215|nr:YbjN domain-containing protein [Jongsikchunia kroppenstedtii]
MSERSESDLLDMVTEALDEHEIHYERHASGGPETVLVVELPGERKLKTAVQLSVGRQGVRFESFVCRRPDEDFEDVYRYLLQQNRKLYGVAYTLDNVGDIYLVGRCSTESMTPDELDRFLGQILEAVNKDFNPLLELGFHSAIRKEWAWRTSRGESLKNLRAFEHLIEKSEDESKSDIAET